MPAASTAPAAAAGTRVTTPAAARGRMSASAGSRCGTRRAIAGARLRLPRRAVTRTRLPLRLCLRLPLLGPIVLTRWIVRLPRRRARTGRTETIPAVGPLVLVHRRTLSRRLARTRLAESPEALGPGRGRLVAAGGLGRTRILGCAAHARLAKPPESGLILSCIRGAAGSSLPGRPAGLPLLSEETHVVARVPNIGRLPVRKLPAARARTHRHLPANPSCHAHPRSGYALDAAEPPVAEVLRADGCNTIGHTRISISICDVYVGDVNPSVEAAGAVEPAAPPRMEGLEWRQRHPSDIPEAKSDAKAHSPAESEEPYPGRRPKVAHAERAGVPAPAEARILEPTAIVVRCPAPGIVAHPNPSIPVFPNPAAIAVRRPAGRHQRGMPDVAVRRHIRPCAGIVQIFRAIDALRNILSAGRLQHTAIAAVTPPVPIVVREGGYQLEFRVGCTAARHHGLSVIYPLRTARREDFHVAGACCNLGFTGFIHGDPVAALARWPHGNARRIQFGAGRGGMQNPVRDRAFGDFQMINTRLQLGQPHFGVAADAQHIGRIELHFRAGIGAGRDPIAGQQRSVDHARHPLCGIASPHRDIPIDQTYASYAAFQIVGILGTRRRRRTGHPNRRARQNQEPEIEYAFHGKASSTPPLLLHGACQIGTLLE